MRQLSSKTKAQSDRIAVTLPLEALSFLQRFALKTKPRDFLKVLLRNTFIPKHKMATLFCVFKTLTGFGF
jgi:hypothetical protein